MKRRTNKTEHFASECTAKAATRNEGEKKLKIEPINKSNAKRIINNNWFENYGATVLSVPGWKEGGARKKSAAKKVVMRLGNGLLMCDDCFLLLLFFGADLALHFRKFSPDASIGECWIFDWCTATASMTMQTELLNATRLSHRL